MCGVHIRSIGMGFLEAEIVELHIVGVGNKMI